VRHRQQGVGCALEHGDRSADVGKLEPPLGGEDGVVVGDPARTVPQRVVQSVRNVGRRHLLHDGPVLGR
jgi:hypothetical protein